MERTAVVVGGGIGGLGAAGALLNRGWSVRVLEQADAFTELGAGISLWPNAFTAMETIGVRKTVGDERMDVAGGVRDWRGRWIVRMDEDSGAHEGTGSAVVAHRPELLDTLLDLVPEQVRQTGARVHSVRHDRDKAVVVYGDGEELAADLVVGADGVRSAVRGTLWPDAAPPRYSGYTAWRAVLPRPHALDGIGATMWAETWGPGAVFGLFPMPGGRVYCYATGSVPAGSRVPDELADLRRRFADWCEPIPALLSNVRAEQLLRHDIYRLPPLAGYVSGRVVLLGDAAHAMLPSIGQGGCQALEDAATLAVLLEAEPDVPTALRRYDKLRRPRTQALARQSLVDGALSHLRPAPLRAVRNTLLRALPTSFFLKSFSKPFDWRPEPAAAMK